MRCLSRTRGMSCNKKAVAGNSFPTIALFKVNLLWLSADGLTKTKQAPGREVGRLFCQRGKPTQ